MTGRPARTAALLYTSADAEGAQGGGFKVTSSRGDLSETELAELVRHRPAAGGLDDDPLPQFATPEQVARGPRALDYRAVLDGVAWWHVAPAGSDATGRGSNRVMQVAFATGTLTCRPVELWRSPEWKTPFGPDQVAAAALRTAVLPQAQIGLSREAVLDGLAGARADALERVLVLIDVVVRAAETGELALVLVDDADDAAWWLAAATHLLPLASAQRVTFSILADAAPGVSALLDLMRTDGIRVGFVARTSLNPAEVPPDVVLVDTDAPVVLGLEGEDHRVGARRVPATELSALALELLVDPDLASAAMAWVDETLEPTVEPRWALAACLLRDPERYADAVAGAADLLVRHAPATIPPELVPVAQRALEELLHGRDAAGLWALYTQLAPTNAFRGPTADAYLHRALTDPAWLDQPAVPAPTEPHAVPANRAMLDALAVAVRPGEGGVTERALLNAVALLTQVGAVRPGAPEAEDDDAARDHLTAIVAARLAPDAPPAVWDLLREGPAPAVLRPVLEAIAAGLVREDRLATARPVGQRLDERVTQWLLPDLRDVLASPAAPDLVAADRVVRASATFAPFSADLARAFEIAVADCEGGGAPSPILARFEELEPRAAAGVLLRHGAQRRLWLNDPALVRFLMTAPWEPPIEQLCHGDGSPVVDTVRDARELRLRSRAAVWFPGEPVLAVVPAVRSVLGAAPAVATTADDHVIALLQAIHCWAEIGRPGSSAVLGTAGATARELPPPLAAAVQETLLAVCQPVSVLAGQLATGWGHAMAPRVAVWTRGEDGTQQPLLEVLARRVLATSGDLTALIASVQDLFPPEHADAVGKALLELAPRGARLAQRGQKMVEGVRSRMSGTRPEPEEKR